MIDTVEDVLLALEDVASGSRSLKLAILDRTRYIIKARLHFTNDTFIQVYVNAKRPKCSYTLIINDMRIFGKDCMFSNWHTHPYENPESHDESEEGGKPVTVREFIEQAIFILSEKLNMI